MVEIEMKTSETIGAVQPAASPRRRYVIISPVRNEGAHLERVIASVVHQTVLPAQWVVINDGSTDNTAEIMNRYARQIPWITAMHLPARHNRAPGTKVVAAFNEGIREIRAHDWDYLVKLDGDLILTSDYFEMCIVQFEKEAGLGVGGGVVFHMDNGERIIEPNPLFHVRGATKIYRRACWEQLGGLLVAPGWDTLDEVKANMLGWSTRSFLDIQIEHLRPTGAADGSWRNSFKNGEANFRSGYHPLFMLLKCVKRFFDAPYLIGSAGLFCGYASSYFRGVPQVDDKQLIGYLRQQQLRRVFLRKSIWK